MDSRCDQLRALGDAARSHEMGGPAEGEPDFLRLPDGPAVVVFEAADGRAILIATTGSARELARRRMGTVEAAPGKVDMRAVCAGGRVLAIRVGSPLEADAAYLRLARERMPEVARVVGERWRAWFAHVDPDAEHPRWSKTNLLGLAPARSASGGAEASLASGVLLGPIPNKDAAGRFLEAVTDAFDLCRYHNLLTQAPRALACAYKEMGRCPAPCDGTETMDDYRVRTREAIDAIARGGIPGLVEQMRAEMAQAAGAQDFDRAASLKKRAERLEQLVKPAFVHVGRLDETAHVLVLGSPERGRVRVALAHRGRLLHIGDGEPTDRSAMAALCGAAEHAVAHGRPLTIDAEAIDSIAVLMRWLGRAEKRRRGAAIRVEKGRVEVSAVLKAAAALLRKGGEPAVEEQEVESA